MADGIGLDGGDVCWICISAASSDEPRVSGMRMALVEGEEASDVRPSGSRIAPSCDERRRGVSLFTCAAVEEDLEGVRSRNPLAGGAAFSSHGRFTEAGSMPSDVSAS